jgi:hypothetical protein
LPSIPIVSGFSWLSAEFCCVFKAGKITYLFHSELFETNSPNWIFMAKIDLLKGSMWSRI